MTSGVSKVKANGSMDELYQNYSGLVYRRCIRLLGSHARSEEAMQDVFVKVLESQDTLDLTSNPGALFYRIATHICFNLMRSSRRRPEVADCDTILALAESPSESALSQEDRLYVKALLESEEESTRLMATYHYIDGMTIGEIAKEFKMSASGVKKRLEKFKIKAHIKDAIDGN